MLEDVVDCRVHRRQSGVDAASLLRTFRLVFLVSDYGWLAEGRRGFGVQIGQSRLGGQPITVVVVVVVVVVVAAVAVAVAVVVAVLVVVGPGTIVTSPPSVAAQSNEGLSTNWNQRYWS